MSWEVGFFVISCAVLLLVIFAVPTLVQIRKSARSAEITLEAVNRELPAILQDLHRITTLTNEVSHNVRFFVEGKVNRTVHFNLKVMESLAKQSGNLLENLQDGVGRISARLDSFRGDMAGIEGKAERELQAKLLTVLKVFIVLIRSARGSLEALLSRG
ncbi:MAG TPA: DUF948 domain-containing protein [Syntrophales bacterium]|nr:DUF948 domain-containing protein [Syntrophales bacterium]HOX93602.1 DUF948 domain-containing protein [Syntrophales bacterium]HPI56897.1 DUF948 domain-containing protein [Syntrophales bacterium]HPN23483.1 DUF948 domain-containing protein [Syntrophales bacterium]HQM27992.1 DUF948 domain-containing protein [Syntrophales bacterium]